MKGKMAHWFGVGWTATTLHLKIEVIEYLNDRIQFRHIGKRKIYEQQLTNKDLLFFCEEVPFIADSDTNKFYGNARLNLIGNEEEIKMFIAENNVNKLFEPSIVMICIPAKGEYENNVYKEFENSDVLI